MDNREHIERILTMIRELTLKDARTRIGNLLNELPKKEKYPEYSMQRMYYSFGIRDACWKIDEMLEECNKENTHE